MSNEKWNIGPAINKASDKMESLTKKAGESYRKGYMPVLKAVFGNTTWLSWVWTSPIMTVYAVILHYTVGDGGEFTRYYSLGAFYVCGLYAIWGVMFHLRESWAIASYFLMIPVMTVIVPVALSLFGELVIGGILGIFGLW